MIKALAAVSSTSLPCLADDSGLCVVALDGEPGVHTADWAGPGRDWSSAMAKVEARLQAAGAKRAEQRRGTFVSYLVLVWPDGHTRVAPTAPSCGHHAAHSATAMIRCFSRTARP